MKMIIKPLCVFLSALLLLLPLSSCGGPVEPPASEKTYYSSYRDIPGVSDADIAAVEALRGAYDSFTYGMTPSTEAFSDVDGDIRGYTAYFCEWLGELFDLPFIPALYTWEALLEGLASGEIDFSGELTANEERRRSYYMTEAIAERSINYFRIEGSRALDEIAAERPLRYVFMEGATTYAETIPSLGEAETYEVLFAPDYEIIYEMLASGEADAFFAEETSIGALDRHGDVESKHLFPPVFSPISLSTQNDALKIIIEVVDKALANGGSGHMVEMYNQGHDDYLRHLMMISLTEEELDYIRNNPVVPYVTQYTNYPLSFFNENESEWQGISFDLLREVERLTGLEFRLAHGDEFIRWPDLLDMVTSGEAAFVTELLRTEARIGYFIWLDTTLTSEYLTLVSEEKMRSIRLNEVKNYTVGVIRNTAQTEAFYRWFPQHEKTVEYEDTREALMGMRAGEVDLVMSSTANLFYVTYYLELTGFKANIVFADTLQEGTLGLNVGEEVLRGIIDKALVFVDIQAIRDEWRNRSFDYRYQLIEAQRPWLIGAVILSLIVMVLVFFLWRRSRGTGKHLEKLVRERTIILERQQRDLEVLMETAETANRAKSDFLATMSHEIRTPMNSIMGFAELAQDSETVPQIKDYMLKIMDSTEWLLRIINDILDISKIEAGKMYMDNEPFNLHEVLSRCQSVILPSVREKGLDLRVYVEPIGGKKLVGDSVRLYQVLINLLSNAVKFTNIGTVRFSALLRESANSHVKIYFEVKDDGIGMSQEQITRIFDPFIQADSSTTRNYGGTGLGLAIVKNIVQLMGGELAVESALDHGSTFSFEIVFDTVEAQDESMERKEFTFFNKPYFDGLILICDDNPLNQEVICEHLSRVGLRTVVAENGKEGVDRVRERMDGQQKPFELIFMDMFMPIMDGLEATEKILALDTGTPIIAMTANLITSELEKYVQYGMSDCLGKPFTSQELWRILLKYLIPINNEPVEEDDDKDELLQTLKASFVKYNQNIVSEINEAHAAGDTKLAHRLAHSLKGSAGLIGQSALRNAALEIESLLKDDAATIWENKMKRLEDELTFVLEELRPLQDEVE